jgi:hypothetical protein
MTMVTEERAVGLFGKLKGAVNALTGGAATVTLEFSPAFAYPGDRVAVKVTARSTGGEVKSDGVFVDLEGVETVETAHTATDGTGRSCQVNVSRSTVKEEFQIGPGFLLRPGDTKVFDGTVQIPDGVQPSFQGALCRHEIKLRGRMQAFGNDPDSGFQLILIGSRS